MSTLVLQNVSRWSRGRLWPMVRNGFKAWWAELGRRKAIADISELDDHLLRDIGISRADIQDALDGRSSSVLFEPFRNSDQ